MAYFHFYFTGATEDSFEYRGLFLPIWTNFNLSMDKWSYPW